MTDQTDYKHAYERQKAARERAELLLEQRSRELYDANAALRQQSLLLESENREGRKLIDRLSRVASQTTNGVVITGLDGCVSWVNASFAAMTGCSAEQAAGRPLADILLATELDLGVIATVRNAVQQLAAFEAEIQLGRQAGADRWVRVSANPMVDAQGAVQSYMAMLVDITQVKQAEKLKQEFTATVSHELRTPLTSVMGAIDLVKSGILGELGNDAADLLDVAGKNCRRLLELIEDLLDMEKLGAGKLQLQLETTDLVQLLRLSIEELQPYTDTLGVGLAWRPLAAQALVECDPRRLHQVVANLVSNAAKFSPAGATVSVTVGIHDNMVRIEVADRGVGIAPEMRDRVFERFYQGDSSQSRAKPGTGLGLAITQELVVLMGGRIGFDSIVGTGTTFWVELPAVQTASATNDGRVSTAA